MGKNKLIMFIVSVVMCAVIIIAVEIIDMFEHIHESITIVMATVISGIGSIAGILHIKDKKGKSDK